MFLLAWERCLPAALLSVLALKDEVSRSKSDESKVAHRRCTSWGRAGSDGAPRNTWRGRETQCHAIGHDLAALHLTARTDRFLEDFRMSTAEVLAKENKFRGACEQLLVEIALRQHDATREVSLDLLLSAF
ncbi:MULTISPECIES: hypothetical protein [Paraburkholderia]|uniref:hypothetical protein n=1 Tax=Paraburkholderia TaxID=1822464 RepID=UPI00225179BE|nr:MULTISPECIES: hypothetical protein [Paraburkholderia]MCX4159676.1 hypothetical protein [Paraburkholderia aspalathi]MDN7169073.1 hypothetical protein [Paraburkholderia sp. SECH2]MDQ6397561.1 hypothetical protein [Paraburkholderia aspalathi]